MATQEIVWTLLPRQIVTGMDGNRLALSVFVSPRLLPDAGEATLAAFPDFLKWPELLAQGLRFSIVLPTGETVEASQVGNAPDLELWQQILPPETLVRARQFKDYRLNPIWSYPVANVAALIKQVYRHLLENSPGNLPGLPFSDDPDEMISLVSDTLGTIVGTVAAEIVPELVDLGSDNPAQLHAIPARPAPRLSAQSGIVQGDPRVDFALLNGFYRRSVVDKTAPPREPLTQPEFDFHKIVAFLADYPALLRRLGLVFDLEIPVLPEGQSQIRLQPNWLAEKAADHFDLAPWTAYERTATTFQARSKGTLIRQGQLDLSGVDDEFDFEEGDEALFSLVTFDPDGAGLKTINFADSVARQTVAGKASEKGIAYTTPDHQGVPSLRTGGLALVERNRAMRLAQRFQDAANWEEQLRQPQNLPVLHAEDLVRGYRVDIADVTNSQSDPVWRSLFQRIGAYRLRNDAEPFAIIEDEGYVKSASTSSTPGEPTLYLHEAMFKWTGWSLAAPRPGRTIRAEMDDDNNFQREVVEPYETSAPEGVPIAVTMRASPGSLPRLRYGQRYRMRVRTVDLAGESLPLESNGDSLATDAVPYLRYEPVDVPVLLLRDLITEGEALENMVIRSNFDQSSESYSNSELVQRALQNYPHRYRAANDRHLAPPKTSQLTAELHEAFDAAMGPNKTADIYDHWYRIAAKEAGTFYDREVLDIETGLKVPLPDPQSVQLITPPHVKAEVLDLPLAPPSPENPTGDRLAPGQYIVHRERQLLLPYLPDVIAAGVAFVGLPGVSAPGSLGNGVEIVELEDGAFVLTVPFSGDWPEAEPFRIEIQESPESSLRADCQDEVTPVSPAPPTWDAESRVLTVFLPKAATAKVRYSCFLNEKGLASLSLWRWLSEEAKEQLSLRALSGTHWMLTPYRELTLVHAVQQPLCAPSLSDVKALPRSSGDTKAILVGNLHYDASSSDKVELLAEWREWVDDVSRPGPQMVTRRTRVLETNIEPDMPDNQPLSLFFGLNPLKLQHHDLGDTRFHLVHYHLRATTRFREYFPPEITDPLEQITRSGIPFPGVSVLTSERAGAPVFLDHAEGVPSGVPVLSSSRPAAPKVLYAVPTFHWQEQVRKQKGQFIRKRLGGGLRVFLDRPWFSSGDGELLGVITAPPSATGSTVGFPSPSDIIRLFHPYITICGKDPIFASNDPQVLVPTSAFPLAAQVQEGVALAERQDIALAVAGHAVEYDEERGLWFADIEIEAGTSYMPFVRLALVRHQPNAIAGAEISPVVLADFAQVVPDRALTLELTGNRRQFSVSVHGIAPAETHVSQTMPHPAPKKDPLTGEILGQPPLAANGGFNEIQIAVEQRDPLVDDPDFGWLPVSGATIIESSESERNLLWRGTVTLPKGIRPDACRIMVKELEAYYQDDPDAPQGRGVTQRVVYADTVKLGDLAAKLS